MTPEQPTPTVNDLIRRAHAIAAVTQADKDCRGAEGARDNIRTLPAYEVGVRELEWVEIKLGQYFEARVIGILYSVRFGTDGIARWQACQMGKWFEAATIEAAKAAAQADYDARIRSALTATTAADVAGRPDAPCTIVEYTNYRGETARRTIIPIKLWWGSTEWHPEDQWMLTAWDIEKGARRDFAWQDMRPVQNPATSAALARMKEAKA